MPDLTPDRALRRPAPADVLADVVRRGRRRRRRLVSAGAVAALVLVAAPLGGLAVLSSDADRLVVDGGVVSPAPPAGTSPAEPCPAVMDVSGEGPLPVPAPPPEAATGALVPVEVPLAVTVCRYADSSAFGPAGDVPPPDQVPLEGERALTGGLEQLPLDLAVPSGTEGGGCTLVGGPLVPYLLRLSYPTGTVWVATRSDLNSCELVTNGAFTSAVYVGDQIAGSYEAGSWVAAPQPDGLPQGGCTFGRSGRAGQERELVPPGWEELTVCVQDGAGQEPRPVPADRAAAVAELLNALPTAPGGGFGASCGEPLEVAGDDDRMRFLRWTYPTGRAVLVIPFVGCDPPVANGSLSAQATAGQQAQLLRLLVAD